MITADTIKSYGSEHMVLVLISVLKARRNNIKKQISLNEVFRIYQAICKEYNLECVYVSILSPLKRLDLAGFIKLSLSKKGGIKIIEVGFGENTPELIETLLYNDPDYAKYKYFEPFGSKNQ